VVLGGEGKNQAEGEEPGRSPSGERNEKKKSRRGKRNRKKSESCAYAVAKYRKQTQQKGNFWRACGIGSEKLKPGKEAGNGGSNKQKIGKDRNAPRINGPKKAARGLGSWPNTVICGTRPKENYQKRRSHGNVPKGGGGGKRDRGQRLPAGIKKKKQRLLWH